MVPYLTSTSRALYHVFIAPAVTASRPHVLNSRCLIPRTVPIFPTIVTRTLKYKRQVKRHALSDYFTYDEAIKFPFINLVDQEGTFVEGIRLKEALKSFNRGTHHLLLATPGKPSESGDHSADTLPVCKIIAKSELRLMHDKKVEIARKRERGITGTGIKPKTIELNWAIAEGDLKHRLEKLKEFLNAGRKLEVYLGPKKGSRKATEKECRLLVKAVRHAVYECQGARETKDVEGQLGGLMTLCFEGQNTEENQGVNTKEEEEEEEGLTWKEKKKRRREREAQEAQQPQSGQSSVEGQ
jgi:translation initiation factor IF-3